MKAFYLILILISILGNELILDYVSIDSQVVFIELSTEDTSEKEYDDLLEDDCFTFNNYRYIPFQIVSNISLNSDHLLRLHPLIDIQSPPPKK
jgi:hypothetical protein